MRKGRVLALLAAIVLLLGGLIYGSLTTIQSECDLCIEYNGQRQCRSGSGSDDAAANDAAQRAACAVLASGMAASIKCQNVMPTNVQCRE